MGASPTRDPVRRLDAKDSEVFAALRLAGLAESPTSFGSAYATDFVNDLDLVRERLSLGDENVVFGTFVGASQGASIGAPSGPPVGVLSGVIGIYRNTGPKARHKANIWGMYVSPDHRRSGHGRLLLGTAISHARSLEGVQWIELGVNSTNAAAIGLYRHAGFERWGCEPDALRHEGKSIDEDRMGLRLDSSP